MIEKLGFSATELVSEESFFSTSHAVIEIKRSNYQGMAIVRVVADDEYYTEKVIIQ